jgi:hypothetical protein
LLGVSAQLLDELARPMSVNRLWERKRDDTTVGTFDRFVLAMDLLFIIGAVEMDQGLLRRTR